MFTLVGFNEASASAGAWANVAGAKDDTTRVIGDVIYVPDKFNKLLWCAGNGVDIVRAKLESPSIRRMGVLMIEPKTNRDYVEFAYYPVARYTPNNMIALAVGEGLEAFVYCGRTHTTPMAILVCLADSPISPVSGEIWTVRATYTSLTPITGEWVSGSLTFDETLPVGNYQLVGASLWHQGGLAFRMVPIGQLNRPGGLTGGGVGAIEPDWQRLGRMGVWCEFHSTTPPKFELLADGTTASTGSMELDLIKTS